MGCGASKNIPLSTIQEEEHEPTTPVKPPPALPAAEKPTNKPSIVARKDESIVIPDTDWTTSKDEEPAWSPPVETDVVSWTAVADVQNNGWIPPSEPEQEKITEVRDSVGSEDTPKW